MTIEKLGTLCKGEYLKLMHVRVALPIKEKRMQQIILMKLKKKCEEHVDAVTKMYVNERTCCWMVYFIIKRSETCHVLHHKLCSTSHILDLLVPC
jgi:hypothetical protein